ncbi:anti-sigma factor [Amycolatopsis sp. RTGN1]|uniref:anti-sigma factor n=1 Tax=Amycolatopsis ponsaeliensis TaxID=2992142 RepID=UPI00254F1479|nr:anti-sigma factor [Amycolatopsis sp. RTGN1]
MTAAEVHTLTGAYVLDAVTDLERAAFDRHLAECPTCAAEVREFRETAARLGAAMNAAPGTSLRSRVLTAVAETRQLPPRVDNAPATGRAWRKRATAVAASIAAAAAILVGGVGIGLSQVDGTPAPVAGFAQVQEASDAVTVRADGSGGGSATATLSRQLGRVVVAEQGLPALDAAHSYQVWLTGPRGPQSAGLLPAGDGTLTAVLPGDTDRIAITTEPAAGSPQPTTAPVAQLPLA